MIRRVLIPLIAIAVPAMLLAADRPRQAVDPRGCVTEECHANIKDFAQLHGPVNVDACDACHRLDDATTHSFSLARPKEQLCTFCHQLDLDRPVVHEPLRQGECLACHDPHGGPDVRFLRQVDTPQLCNTCHEDVRAEKQHVHGPVAAGACNVCHAPHAADHPNLLPETGRDLCVGCHQETDRQLQRATFIHEPVRQDCVQCHDAHASNQPMMVHHEPAKLCVGCHEPIGKAIAEAPHQHSAVTEDGGCANCHTPHGSTLRGLMKDEPVKLCLACHSEPIRIDDERTVAAVNEIADPDMIKHGPAADGTCGGCHEVHGSQVSRLLSKPYPEEFYSPFEVDRFALCFSCHDQQLVLQRRTDALTGFRNADLNLHYVHVNKPNRGRTCRACHNTHASTNPLHVAETVPFGNWQLPINFTRTDTGGTCAPGCHQALGYDREEAIDPTAAPRPLDEAARQENR